MEGAGGLGGRRGRGGLGGRMAWTASDFGLRVESQLLGAAVLNFLPSYLLTFLPSDLPARVPGNRPIRGGISLPCGSFYWAVP